MKSTKHGVAAWLAAMILAGTAFADERESYERVVPFEAGGSFSLENLNGSIRIETWDDGNVRIEAEKKANTREALDDIEIVVDASGDSVRVETVHKRRRNRGSVSYVISLPADANVSVDTANGAVTIEGIRGRVEAKSVNGSVKVENTTGSVDASTTNGSIQASYLRADAGNHRFKTTNGSVRVYLPGDAGGEFEAGTVNGRIHVDFPTNLTRAGRRHMAGSFGSGGASFEISTVNGSVKILPKGP